MSCCVWPVKCRIRRWRGPRPAAAGFSPASWGGGAGRRRPDPLPLPCRQAAGAPTTRGRTTNPADDPARAHNAHSAVFAEVKVDDQLGIIRVTRIVSAVAAGRILNTKTASSQVLGGVVWGIGMALHEETLIDHKLGRIMNANLAEYHVPVNADVHDIKVIFVDEADDSNPLGVKGVGESGICGVASAIASAVYHAAVKLVRDLTIALDKLGR